MHFGENQLSPGSFGISPLSTAHPSVSQGGWVRSSSSCYRAFNLAMDSSPGFGSTPCDSKRPVQTRFRCGSRPPALNLATRSNSPAHSSIGTPLVPRQVGKPSTACRHTVSGSFHSPSGVLFTFPSRYWYTIGRQEYLALEGGPPSFPRDFTCPAVLKHSPCGT